MKDNSQPTADQNSELMLIRETVQHVVSAISAVLGVEVAIIGNNFELIATSKTFHETRGDDVNETFVNNVYRKGVAVIPNPGQHEFCTGCKYEGNCPETAEVLRVIEHDGQRYGVILLVAYTASQKEKLLNNTGELLEFISEMTNLIYNEILLQKSFATEKLMKRQLETTMDFVDTGIITVNEKGLVKQINNKARVLTGTKPNSNKGKLINHLLPKPLVDQLLLEGKKITRCEVDTGPSLEVHCLLSANPIIVDDTIMGAVLRLSDFRDVVSTVYQFSGQYIDTTFTDILGHSEPLRLAKDQAERVAKNDSTILILGESGTGKELFARAIHTNSHRREQPFIAINCAAIPEALLESELFGYDDGAFTGSRKGGKPGKFEMAAGGTLFLDEIGDMPLHMQAKILRVLQEGRIERVGGLKTKKVDVRIIAATHRELDKLVEQGTFREDLFYRLNVVPILVPPLRKRQQDISVLLNYFLEKYNLKMQRKLSGFSEAAMNILQEYHWPGNVRELQNSVEYAINIESGDIVSSESLPSHICQHSTPQKQPLPEKVRAYELLLIQEAMKQFDNSVEGKKRAAKTLGISLPTLYRKLREFELQSM
ncbi:MAG: sigma-54 interaction domain-containing protein [Desulfopila sp.]